MADPVQRDPHSQHWTQHGPYRSVDLKKVQPPKAEPDVLYQLQSFLLFVVNPKLFYSTGGSGNFIYTLATGLQENEVARLVSPLINFPETDLCVSFWYHMFGSHIGTLHIKQRKQTADGPADILLWTVSGHQGNRWREGRVLVPRTNIPYQVSLS